MFDSQCCLPEPAAKHARDRCERFDRLSHHKAIR